MRRERQKFYDRYCSLYSYRIIDSEEDVFIHTIQIPEKDNFKQHLDNIRRLLGFEFGGVYEIEFWDEQERTIETNIPFRVYTGLQNYDDSLSDEENEKVGRFLRYKIIGEIPIKRLW